MDRNKKGGRQISTHFAAARVPLQGAEEEGRIVDPIVTVSSLRPKLSDSYPTVILVYFLYIHEFATIFFRSFEEFVIRSRYRSLCRSLNLSGGSRN